MARTPHTSEIQTGDCCSTFVSPRLRRANLMRTPRARRTNNAEAKSFPKNNDTLAPVKEATNPHRPRRRQEHPQNAFETRQTSLCALMFALSGAPLFGATALECGFRPLPVSEEDGEGDVVRHQQGRNPECGDPVRRPHVGRRTINRGECYGGD